MSRLLVVIRPELAVGFWLAGVEAYAAEDVEAAEEMISTWLEEDEVNLLAIDDGLLARMDPELVKRLSSSENLPYLAIPGGEPLGPEMSRSHRIREIIRRAIGFHIRFKREEIEK